MTTKNRILILEEQTDQPEDLALELRATYPDDMGLPLVESEWNQDISQDPPHTVSAVNLELSAKSIDWDLTTADPYNRVDLHALLDESPLASMDSGLESGLELLKAANQELSDPWFAPKSTRPNSTRRPDPSNSELDDTWFERKSYAPASDRQLALWDQELNEAWFEPKSVRPSSIRQVDISKIEPDDTWPVLQSAEKTPSVMPVAMPLDDEHHKHLQVFSLDYYPAAKLAYAGIIGALCVTAVAVYMWTPRPAQAFATTAVADNVYSMLGAVETLKPPISVYDLPIEQTVLAEVEIHGIEDPGAAENAETVDSSLIATSNQKSVRAINPEAYFEPSKLRNRQNSIPLPRLQD